MCLGSDPSRGGRGFWRGSANRACIVAAVIHERGLRNVLTSAGIALLGIAGLAGLFFLLEHRRLKAKPPLPATISLPSLEALDRVNVVTTAVGFALLTLGILTGMIWLNEAQGMAWMGTTHEAWMVISWAIYAGLVAARYAGRQGPRQAAASALAGFAFLLFGVVGVGVMS